MSTMSTFGAFTAARLGIYASMKGLSVTGNNIANINTVGYTRQVLDQISLRTGGHDRYQAMYEANVGSGVLCTGVSQIRDPYLDIRYRNEQANVGSMDAKMAVLESLQSILDEVGKGEDEGGIVEAQFNDLISQLQKLSSNVGSGEMESLVRSSAKTLVGLLNDYAGKIETIRNDTITDFKQDISTANGILESIRDLNESIRNSEIHGDGALELRDERNRKIDELSRYMKIDVTVERESIGGGDTVERLVIKLAGNGQHNDTERSTLVYGVYATQVSIKQLPTPNPDYDPDVAGSLPYLDKNGNPTDDEAQAKPMDDPNYTMMLEALKDSEDRVMVRGKSQVIPRDAFEAAADTDEARRAAEEAAKTAMNALKDAATADGYPKTAPNGDVTYRTYAVKELTEEVPGVDGGASTTKTTYTVMETTRTVSGQVELGDNDLYGAFQATREMLTEAGEFTKDAVVTGGIDPKAAIKRGIPYYQNALDALAQKFAAIMNGANAGHLSGDDGSYVDENGNPVEITLEWTATDGSGSDLTAALNPKRGEAAQWPEDYLASLGVERDADGQYKLDSEGYYLNADGDRVTGHFNGENVLLNRSWTTELLDAAKVAKGEGAGVLLSAGSDGDDPNGITAANISISKGWSTGATKIQASQEFDAPSMKGDNILHLITQLSTTKFDYRAKDVVADAYEGDQVFFNGTIQEMLANIAATRADEARITGVLLNTYAANAVERDTNRDSVSGVDLNDEAANLMMYQKTYSAACRVMTTIDEALDKLINGTGVVGR